MRRSRYFAIARPENVFVLMGLLWGLFFCLATPPFQSPDEFNHFFRAYQVSEGAFLAEKHDARLGGRVPKSVRKATMPFRLIPHHPERKTKWEYLTSAFEAPPQPDRRVFVDFPNTALYAPISYLPQAFGMWVGKCFGAPPILLLYLGRLANLLAWGALIYLSIGIIPIMKWGLVALALTPMSLFEASTLSADTLTNALAFILTSLLLRAAFGRSHQMGGKDLLAIFVVSMALSLSKNAYVPILLLYFLIPAERVGSRRRYFFVFACLVLANFAVLASWAQVVHGLYVPSRDYNPLYRATQPLRYGVLPEAQLQFIVSHPIHYLSIVIQSYREIGNLIVWSFVGILGWLDVELPPVFAAISIVVLCIIGLCDTNERIRLGWRRLAVLGIFLVSVFTLTTVLYLVWVPVASPDIHILQGRYFIPLSPICLLLFFNSVVRVRKNYLCTLVPAYAAVSLSIASYTLLRRYYGF